MNTVFVLGGCKSGKSAEALRRAEAFDARERVFVATCVPRDGEMDERVRRHQAERGDRWRTVEEPVALADIVAENAAPGRVVLVDCLTLWVTNLMLAGENPNGAVAAADGLARALAAARGPVVLVANEVGAGIVPENALARAFRDAAGLVNQRIAATADHVVWCVAGIPVTVKPRS